MLDVFVGKTFTVGTLGEADSFSQGAVVGFAVDGVELLDGSAAGDAYGHACLVGEVDAMSSVD